MHAFRFCSDERLSYPVRFRLLKAAEQSIRMVGSVQLGPVEPTSQVLPDLVPLASAATACNRADTMFAWRWSLHLFTLARWVGHTPNLRLHNCAISAASRLPGGLQRCLAFVSDVFVGCYF